MLTATLVGFGARGKILLPALRSVPGVEVVAVADCSREVRRQILSETGLPSFDPLATDWPIKPSDVFVLATPAEGRAELVERLAQPGVRGILAEKPVAFSLLELDRMRQACETAGTQLSVFQHWRYCPALNKLRDLLQAGACGEIESIHGTAYGNLLDQGWHLLDAIRWLLNEPAIAWAAAHGSDDCDALRRVAEAGTPVEVDPLHPAPLWTSAELALTDGVRVQLDCGPLIATTNAPLGVWHERRLRFCGTRGTAEVRPGHYLKVAGVGTGVREWNCDPGSLDGATRQLLVDFCAAVEQGTAVPCPAREVRETLAGLVLCGESIACGEVAIGPASVDANPFQAPADQARYRRTSKPLANAGPTYSVLIPLECDRNYLQLCLDGWLGQDGTADHEYELLWIDASSTPDNRRLVQSRLRPQDRIICEAEANRARQYDAGARAARGRYLVFSESHCRPERELLRGLSDFFLLHDVDGACLRSIAISHNVVSRADANLCMLGFDQLRRDCDWRKFNVHGVALLTEAYLAVGGLQSRYENFSEMLLAADLRDAGYRLGFAGGAAVHHLYRHSPFDLHEEESYARGERQYRRDHGSVERIGFSYLELCGDVLDSPTARRESIRAEWQRLRTGVRSGDFSAAGPLVSLLAGEVRNGRWARPIAQAERWLALAGCTLFRFSDRLTEQWFLKLVRAMFRNEWLRLQAQSQDAVETVSQCELTADKLCGEVVFGFHPLEQHNGAAFRWSLPTAGVDLPLAPGDYQIEIVTGGIRPWPASLRWSLNGEVLSSDQVVFGERSCWISLSIPETRAGLGSTLGLSCNKWDIDDARRLGLPMFGIRCTPVELADENGPVLLPFPEVHAAKPQLLAEVRPSARAA
ncbi:MAG: Gfo/Idh/MocA family oxidoreductase [Planctomycetaceae bacterium]